jgi:hypothetical protein
MLAGKNIYKDIYPKNSYFVSSSIDLWMMITTSATSKIWKNKMA